MLVDALPPPAGCDMAVWVPGMKGLRPGLADVAALLPVRALNETLASSVGRSIAAMPPVVAGVLAIDPFLSGSRLYRLLADRGVRGVVNMPSVAPADGALGQALGAARLGPAQEIAALAQARAHGLEPLALVFTQADASSATAAGIRRFLLHPGLPRGGARQDRKLAEVALALLDRLRDRGHEVLLYRHPELDGWLPEVDAVPGQLAWRVSAGATPPHPSP